MTSSFHIRPLSVDDRPALEGLFAVIEAALPEREWWLPVQDIAREHFFDFSWTRFYGAFDGERLIAASALFLNKFEYGDSAKVIGIPLEGTGEIGRCKVHPDYRGQNLMLRLNRTVFEVARDKRLQRVIATVHPDNTASCRSLVSLGMQKAGKAVRQGGFQRDIYLMSLV